MGVVMVASVAESRTQVAAAPAPRPARALTAAASVLAVVVVWLIAVPLLGVVLRVPMSGHAPLTVTLPLIVAVTAAVSSAGWGLLAMLARYTAYARTVWLGVAVTVLVISYAAPLSSAAAPAAIVVLTVLHTAVAAVLIPGLARTAPGAPRRLTPSQVHSSGREHPL